MRLVLDTSVLVAIVNAEPEADHFHQLLLDNETLMSCGTLIETLRVMQVGLGAPALVEIDRLLELYRVDAIPVDREQVALAREGMLAYGKGRRIEPAVLNFGDLFAYALAKQLNLPLLFKGEDFARTDVTGFA